MQANPEQGQAAAGRSKIRWNRNLFSNVQPGMTQTQHVEARPVPQYEPALGCKSSEDRSATVWRDYLATADEEETGAATEPERP